MFFLIADTDCSRLLNVAAPAGHHRASSCHSIKQRVVLLMQALAIATLALAALRGEGLPCFCFFGFLKTARMPLSGLGKIIPEFTP